MTKTLTPAPASRLRQRLFDATRVAAGLALLTLFAAAWADEEASNIAHLASSSDERCYAESVPDEAYGQRGTTRV